MTERLLVTGGRGFVGAALARAAVAQGGKIRASVRTMPARGVDGVEYVVSPDLNATTDWSAALRDVAIVVHCAARVHVMNDSATDILSAFRAVNVDGTLCLARQAAEAGVKRFVFISSVKVNGEATQPGQAFRETDPADPQDPYGISKHEAEQELRDLACSTGMEVVIIRPPLVYGPEVKANFAALVLAVQNRRLLPLGAVHNQRSLVALDNLVDLILLCTRHPLAANQTFLASDGNDLSTTELVRGMARAAKVPPRLVSVPAWAMRGAATLMGKRAAVNRLFGNLQVDSSKARELLGWIPPISVDEGLRRAILGRGNSDEKVV